MTPRKARGRRASRAQARAAGSAFVGLWVIVVALLGVGALYLLSLLINR